MIFRGFFINFFKSERRDAMKRGIIIVLLLALLGFAGFAIGKYTGDKINHHNTEIRAKKYYNEHLKSGNANNSENTIIIFPNLK